MKKLFEKIKNIDKRIKTAFLVLVLLAAGGTAFWYFFYSKYETLQNELTSYKNNPKLSAIKDKYDIIREVSEMVEVPSNEEPTVANISNVHRLQNQKFFENAQNGDKLVFYRDAKRAILYRPSTNKIIEIATVNVQEMDETVTESTSSVKGESTNIYKIDPSNEDTTPTVNISIYNGTRTVSGLAKKTELFLEKNVKEYKLQVAGMGDTSKVFDESIVVSLNEDTYGVAEDLADYLGATVTELPDSEGDLGKGSDIVIIIGYTYNEAITTQ
ncbi:hypothetical protein JXA34_00035 [Patescibacteria group bacterium]|nr:hypothetical protein [Patescibacteria group bacterium]